MPRGAYRKGETNPYCPAAARIAMDQPQISRMRVSGWLGIAPSTLTLWAKRCGYCPKEQHVTIREVKPCGFNICPAAIRVVWSPEISKRHVGQWLGISGASATRWAATAGLDTRVNARPAKTISVRAVRDAWLDSTITTTEAAKKLGLANRSLYQRAVDMDLPPRKSGVIAKPWPDDFDAMWEAGLTTRDMAKLCKRAAPSHITLEARRRKLPGRRMGGNSKAITPAQYEQIKLRNAMAATAEIEQSRWKIAGMVDGRIYERKVA